MAKIKKSVKVGGKSSAKTAAKPSEAKKAPRKSPTSSDNRGPIPGQLEVWTPEGVVEEALPMSNPLEQGAPFAVRFRFPKGRPHVYVVHKHPETKLVTPLLHVVDAKREAKLEARMPMEGWLWFAEPGFVIAAASDVPLTRAELAKLLKGRAPKPVIGDDKTMGVPTQPT
jgi:hypothetical protein